MRTLKGLFWVIVAIFLVIAIGWGCTMLGKWLSYKFFYESQVKETIHEVLREEGLIGRIK